MRPSFAGVRDLAAGLLGLAGAATLGWWLNRFQPIEGWFIFQLAAIWAWQLFLVAALTSVGHLLVSRLVPHEERTGLETIALSFPAGLVVFIVCMYLGGYLHLYGRVFAVALPAFLLGAGASSAGEALRSASALQVRLSPAAWVASIAGVLLLGVIYLGAMTPDAVNYDASWMHLVIAQDFAREGHIIGFPGNWVLNTPHSASLVYTWCFLVPGFELPALRWMMALHTEFVVVVWCLVGIAALARWLCERDVAATWVTYILFPAIFVYDSNIGGAADHFAMLFVPAVVLMTGVAAKRLDAGACLLWGGFAGAAIICKLQAVYLIAPLALVLTVRAALLARADPLQRKTLLRAWALLPAAALGVMAWQFGGNLVFFNNPVYPLGQTIFTASSPTVTLGAEQASYIMADFAQVPQGTLIEKVTSSAAMVATFSFVAHYSFINSYPMFGSLFTLALPLLLVIGKARRVSFGAAIAVIAIFLWAMTYRVDRNLQLVYPLVIAVTAAIFVRAWELGWLARAGIGAMVAIQLAWGAALFVSGSDRIQGAIALLRSTLDGQSHAQLQRYRAEFVALGRSLPPEAKLLVHRSHVTLGIDRPLIIDWYGFQGLLDYSRMRGPADLHRRLDELGVTHVASFSGWGAAQSIVEEVVFDLYADACARARQSFGGFTVFAACKQAPAAVALDDVLVLGVPGYADGLYPLADLTTNDTLPAFLRAYPAPRRTGPVGALLSEANAVFSRGGSPPAALQLAALGSDFRQVPALPGAWLWVRRARPAQPAAADAPCQAAADFYGISGGQSVGFAPAEVQAWWTARGCEALPRTTLSQQCQNAANLYGIVGGSDWGSAPESGDPARTWWSSTGCNAAPQCEGIAALYGDVEAAAVPSAVQAWWRRRPCNMPPVSPRERCQRMTESFGMRSKDAAYAPAWVKSVWAAAQCDAP